jgi:acetyl esterase/lipase
MVIPGEEREVAGAQVPTVHADIIYAVHDDVALHGDMYTPPGKGPFPIVVAAPGGGWAVCDKASIAQWAHYLARHGIAFFAIRYRAAAAEKTFPHSVRDVLSAVQFVRGSAAQFDIDPARLALLGSSAGAHVAALATLAGGSSLFADRQPAEGHGNVDPSVQAFLGIYGVYDLFAQWQQDIATFPEAASRRTECFLGVPPYADRQLYFDASPISHVRYAANAIPVFLAYGTEDDIVSAELQSRPFSRALRQAGFSVKDCPVQGASHFWFSEEPIEEPGSYTGYLAPRLLRFLKRNL